MSVTLTALPCLAAFVTIPLLTSCFQLVLHQLVVAAMVTGQLVGRVFRGDAADRFTLDVEFATRNAAVAAAIGVTVLGQMHMAVFATVYVLVEIPIMLVAIAMYRHRSDRVTRQIATIAN